MDISVVIPVRNEAEALQELLPEMRLVMDSLGAAYEVLIIDDGSQDQTWPLLSSMQEGWGQLKLIQLRKSHGQTAALQAGFDHSSGGIIVTLDGDGQNDPGDIIALLKRLEEGYDVAVGWRVNRQDAGISRQLPSRIANWLIRAWAGSSLHDQGCALKAIRRDCLDSLRIYGEQHRYLAAFLEGQGAKTIEIPVNHRPRTHGQSHYGWGRLPRVILDLLFLKYFLSFSHRPLHLFGGVGLLSFGIGFLACLQVTYAKFVNHTPAADRPLLLLGALLILTGLNLVALGILGELLVRSYHEVTQVRSYQVRSLRGFK